MKNIKKIRFKRFQFLSKPWLCRIYICIIFLGTQQAAALASVTDNTNIIRIAFYYLPTTLDNYSNLKQLEIAIEEQVNQANYIYQNSEIDVMFEVAVVTPWPTWSDNSAHANEWPDYSATKIYLEAIPYVKLLWDSGEFHAYEADALFIVDFRDPSDSYCGWATIDTDLGLMDKTTTSSYGVFRLGHGCGTSASVLAHELGHLLGAAHGHDEPLEATSHIGYGVECGGKSTLMYPTFPKHDFISDPDKTEGGEACGFQDAADNVKLFNQRVPLLAAKVPTFDMSTADSMSHDIGSTDDDLKIASNSSTSPSFVSKDQGLSLRTAGSASGGTLTPMIIFTLLLTSLCIKRFQISRVLH